MEVLLEGVDLASEGVAPHGDVEAADRLLARRPRPRPGRPAGSSRRRCRRPAAPRRPAPRSGSSRSKIRASLTIVVDSPPGQDQAVDGIELGRAAYGGRVAPQRASGRRRCSRTSPWRARTPIVWFTSEDPTDRPGPYPRPHEALPRHRRRDSGRVRARPRRARPRPGTGRSRPRPRPRPPPLHPASASTAGPPRVRRRWGCVRPAWRRWPPRRGPWTRPATPWCATTGWPGTGTGERRGPHRGRSSPSPSPSPAPWSASRRATGRCGSTTGSRATCRSGAAPRPRPSRSATCCPTTAAASGPWTPTTAPSSRLATARRYAVDLPQQHPPGSAWAYNNAAIQVLEAVLSRATGTPVDRYAARRLFTPLGMSHTRMITGSSGRSTSVFFGLQTTCLDLARFGRLYLGRGKSWTGAAPVARLRPAVGGPLLDRAQRRLRLLWWLNRPGPLRGATDPVDAQGQPLTQVSGQLAPQAPASTSTPPWASAARCSSSTPGRAPSSCASADRT